MGIITSGSISLEDDIRDEFGGSAPHSLSEYYRNAGLVPSGNLDVPTSGSLSFSDFYGTTDVQNRDIRIKMSHTGSSYSAFGVTSITDRTPQSYSGTGSFSVYSPVFRAGTGYLGTSITFKISQNEDTSGTNVYLYSGTSESSVSHIAYRWQLGVNGDSGGNRSYRLDFNADGSISSLTQTGTQYYYQIVSKHTDNPNSGHVWYRWRANSPSSSSKTGTIISGQPTTNSSVPQPT